MKLITRDTDYAVRALCYIAKNKDRVVSVSELVSNLKIPRPFLRKILQLLNRNRILRSSKGKGGGFFTLRPVGKIFLTDLMRIFQGPLGINECLFKKRICPERNICILRAKICDMERRIIPELKNISIKDLL